MFEDKDLRRSLLIAVTVALIVGVPYAWYCAGETRMSGEDAASSCQTAKDSVMLEESDATDDVVYINQETSYRAAINDAAQLLDEEERQELAAVMQGITAYGNVLFKTADNTILNTEAYARQYYQEKLGTASGILLLIDMDNRMLWIHSDGAVYQVITKAEAKTITDNVYRHASDGDYYTCAQEAFGQAQTLLEGNRIARPMKYISNAFLAVILALLLNYGLVCFFAGIGKSGRKRLPQNAGNYFRYTPPQAYYIRESRTYHPTDSGGSHSSGSSGSSGGSSSSGSSGGGGGHRF